FRDLAILFYPYRQFAAEGLRMGQVRYWDPFVHEGVPLLYPPVSYPVDLLQGLWLDLRCVSLLLALHVPLAAAAMVLLARRFGLAPAAAAAAGVVYALGGYLLSTVNVYFHVQAAAWAPLAILGLRSAAAGRRRGLVGGAVAVGLMFSTIG